MLEEVIQFKGKQYGPTSIILAGVHGDETSGVEAFKKMLPTLVIDRGRVLFGYGNPAAIAANTRFTEANLNRMFKDDDLIEKSDKESCEYRRSQFLKKYLDQAEALLDIHASSIPNTEAFAICEANAKGIVEYLPVGLVVSGFDTVEPGGTDSYMNSTGKIGICLESGYIGDPRAMVVAEDGISAFLKARGHMDNDVPARKQTYVRMYDLYATKTDRFILSKDFENFEVVEAGQCIGIDGAEAVIAEKCSMILFAHNCKKIGSEAFLLGEKKESLA